jgi:serine/threonine protein kinase
MDKNGTLNETDPHVDNYTIPIVTSIPRNASFSKNMTSTSSIVKPTQPSSGPDCELFSPPDLIATLGIWIFKGQQCIISATRVRYGVFDIMAQENLPTIESVQNWTNWTEWTSLAQIGPSSVKDKDYFLSQPDTHPSNKTAYIQYKFSVGKESDRSSHTYMQPVGFYSHIAPSIIRAVAEPKDVQLGGNLTIRCDAHGIPKPKIGLKIDYYFSDNVGLPTQNGDAFYFESITVPNATYTCTAYNFQLDGDEKKQRKTEREVKVNVSGSKPPSSLSTISPSIPSHPPSTTTSSGHLPLPPVSHSIPGSTVSHPAASDIPSTTLPEINVTFYAIGGVVVLVVIAFFIVLTFVVIICCKSRNKRVPLKPWGKDARPPNLPYIFNDDYYKSKYGLVGDHGLTSIARKDIEFGEVIGEGHFGTVYKAILNGQEGMNDPIIVAAKCINFYGSTERMRDFFREARFMGHLNHRNIAKLYGICMNQEPFYLIAEYMSEGDLRHFLQRAAGSIERRVIHPDKYRDCRISASSCDPPQLAEHELVYICLQIAQGMKYMAEHGQVHRDLAARNCLVGANLVVKIADFGLSRSLYNKNYYRVRSGAEVPVRWLAPEALIRGEFTLDSDVWSFGIVMWEVFSFGHHPYYTRANDEILNLIAQGYVLEQPLNCPGSMYTIMKNCWKWDPSQRPPFSELASILDDHYTHLKMGKSVAAITTSLSCISESEECEREETDIDDEVFVEEGSRHIHISNKLCQTTEV